MGASNPVLTRLSFAVAAVCLLPLAACSGPSATNGDGSAVNGAGTQTSSQTTAQRFAACLTGKGFDARAAASVPSQGGQETGIAVELRMIDKSGNPMTLNGDSAGVSSSGDQTGAQSDPYANAAYVSVEGNARWVVFKDSRSLAGSPYESKREDYAACEREHPDFTQPVPDNGQPFIPEADKQTALDYAKQARSKGFAWVADPDAANPTTIMIPRTVSESEFRRLLSEVPDATGVISYGFDGSVTDYGWDYDRALEEASR